MERNDKIKQALQKQRSKTTASMEFYNVFKQNDKQRQNVSQKPLYLIVDNTGLKLYLRKSKPSFSENQFDLWLQRQSKQ